MLINQTETAIRSFHAHEGSGLASGQRELILGFIELRGGSWSIGELARALEMQKSTVSARLFELLSTGHLEERPKRKDRVSGILIRPVALPAIQLGLF